MSIKKTVTACMIGSVVLVNCGCWNYREVDQMAVVAGVAIDKGTEGKYKVTAEYVEISSEKGTKPKPKLLVTEGNSVFDAVRNAISISGLRLYWSHSKVVIVCEEIAKEGILHVLDWYHRDAETRADINVLVSKVEPADSIFKHGSTEDEIVSFTLDNMIKHDISLSKISHTEVWEFANDLASSGISATCPAVDLINNGGKKTVSSVGSAIFKGDQLQGYINADDTQCLLFILDDIKGGVLVEHLEEYGGAVAYEIFKNKTKVKPTVNGSNISFSIETKTSTALDEIQDGLNYMKRNELVNLEKNTGKNLAARLERFIQKIQKEFGLDIFGFGSILRQDNVKAWKKVSGQWNETFKNMDVSVTSTIEIKDSAMLAEPIKQGD